MTKTNRINTIINFLASTRGERANTVVNIMDDNDFTLITCILADYDKWHAFKKLVKPTFDKHGDTREQLTAIANGLDAILWPIYVTG